MIDRRPEVLTRCFTEAERADLAPRRDAVPGYAVRFAAKEAVNLEFHDKFLKTTAEQDEARAKKMESFYKEIVAKEAELEARWESRHNALETEYQQRAEALKKKPAPKKRAQRQTT